MNFNTFTNKSQEAVKNAHEIASSYGNQSIEPEHLLAALVQDAQGIVVPVLQKIGANVNHIKIKVNEVLDKLPDFWADEHGFGHGFNRTAPAGHRHGSHLLMLYPLFLANIDQPERREVLPRTVEQLNSATGLPAASRRGL